MKSLIVDKDGNLEIREISKPVCNEYQALVKMLSCGVCNGTDSKLIHRNFKNFSTYPAALGHEGVGRVVETGAKVKNLKAGDMVLLPFQEGMIDNVYSGWGAYSEYATVWDCRAITEGGKGPGTPGFPEGSYAQQVIPGDMDPVEASMIVTFREVLSAIKRFDFKPNNSLVIFGAGPVGLCFTKFAKLLGLGPVIVFDIVDEKLKEASAMGADYVFNNMKVNTTEEVRKICSDGVDLVVDAVGINQLINLAMELIKYNGKICCYGISPKTSMELDWSKAPYNWTVQFVQWPLKLEEAEAHTQIMSWLKMGVLNPADFISDVVPFENIIDAFRMVEEKRALKKIVIKF